VLSPLETIHAKKMSMEKDNWIKNLTNTTVKKLRKNCSLTNRRVKKEKKGAAAQLIGRKGKND